ncbi:MAG: hypothetical protein OEZ34_14110 [Spirochaetia bacterium]|nr:hypothetical protein [Spirochaetia bacterium]
MTSKKNIYKLSIAITSAALFFMSCASSKLKEPSQGEKPGAVVFGIFMADKKFGKKPKLNNQMASIHYVQYAEKTSDGYRHVNIKGNDEVYMGNIVAESNFATGKEYTMSYIEKIDNIKNNIYIMKYYFDPAKNGNIMKINVEPGKIKFIGIFCAIEAETTKGKFLISGKKAFGLVPGLPVIKEMEGARYPQSTYLKHLKRSLFGKYELTNKGAEKHMLDQIIKRNSAGYWYDLALNQRQQLK